MQGSKEKLRPLAFGRGGLSRTEYANNVDAQALAAELQNRVRGEVRFDEGSRALYATDGSVYRQVPVGVVIPRDADGAHAVMAGKTADNIEALEILTYDGTRMRVGATSEHELERIIASGGRQGEIYAGLKQLRDRYAPLLRSRYPKIPRNVSGYALDWLLPEHEFHVARALVGTEGTCVSVLEATTILVDRPLVRVLLVLGYTDILTPTRPGVHVVQKQALTNKH